MFQKVYIIASLSYISLLTGFVFGQMSGLIGALQKKEEGINLQEGSISLIASVLTLVSFIGFALAAVTSDKTGRRWPFILFNTTLFINWIILYYAREMYQFMLSRIFAGISVGALISLNLFVISEFTSPDSRAFFLNIVTVIAPAVGTILGHILGTFLQWRIVSLIGAVATALSVFLPYFWMESPHWLASKCRFKECTIIFQKLHGTSDKSMRELQLLIKFEKSKLEIANKTNCRPTWKRLLVVLRKKYMWEVFILSLFMHGYIVASGKLTFSLLGLVIIEDITGSSNVFLYTLLVDAFLLLGPCISCCIIRKTTMRTLLFSSGFTANAILVVFCVCYYFRNGQNYSNWINIGLLALYYIIINAGPYPVFEALYSEIFPLDLKFYIFSISCTILMVGFSLSVFLLPYIVKAIDYHGMFLINACIMTISLGYIWFKIPETKGKTLQEIEIYFKTKNFDIETVLSNEQSIALI